MASWYGYENYFLIVGLEPLLEVGCTPAGHRDGDVRPLLDMLLAAGVEGLQGRQSECRLTLNTVV